MNTFTSNDGNHQGEQPTSKPTEPRKRRVWKGMTKAAGTGLFALALLNPTTIVQAQFTYTTNAGVVTLQSYTGAGGAVIISNFVNIIGTSAFEETSLTSITIPGSVTSIGDYAFEQCFSMTNVTIGKNVVNIGEQAFEYCTNLFNVSIPNSVTNIGEYAFDECESLVNVTLPNSVTSIETGAFLDCTSLTTATIGNGITNMEAEIFRNCTSLTSVTISNGLAMLGYYMFEGCTNLINVSIPNSVVEIGREAFDGCTSLTNATIGNGVTTIDYGAFIGCSNLSSVTIPGSVTSIAEEAFYECIKLTMVYFTGDAPTADGTVFSGDNLKVYYLSGTTGWSAFAADTGISVVLWNPLIQASGTNFGVRSNRFGFVITGTNNYTVVVEACTNLANPVWTPLQILMLTNGSAYFSDPHWTNYSCRFYGLGLP